MVHNFTQENHSNVSRFFVAINPDANDRVIALAQQFRGKHSRVLARIGGSGLVDSIIREHSRMASVKRSARQQIDAVFSNMSAADIPYGQTTLSDLNSANSLIATFLNALGIAAFDVKTGGIDNIDRSVRYLASAGVTSGGKGTDLDTVEMNLKLETLAKASDNGYTASKDSNDPLIIQARNTMGEAKEVIEAENKEYNEDDAFAIACMITAIRESNKYGANKATEFSEKETVSVNASMMAMNPNSSGNMRKAANKVLNDLGYKNAPYNASKVCVPYVCDAYQNTSLFNEDTKGLPKYKHIIRQTSPFYSALAGGESRNDGKVTNTDIPNKYVKAVVSLGNEDEAMKIKVAGSDKYIDLYDGTSRKFTLEEQKDILIKAQVTQKLDIALFANDSYKNADGKTIRKGQKEFNPDVSQKHAVLLDSESTYSGMGAESGSAKSSVQQNKPLNTKNKNGIDVILMNHNPESINQSQSLIDQKYADIYGAKP